MSGNLLVLRVDASAEIGLGHLMRCVALAQAWQQTGGAVEVLMSQPSAAVSKLAEDRGLPLLCVESLPGVNDAAKTRAHCRQMRAEWLVVDGYRFDSAYLRAVQQTEVAVLVIDDLMQLSEYPAQIVLNPNLATDAVGYRGAPDAGVLCGTQYALIRPEFNWPSGSTHFKTADRSRLLVLGGGADVGHVSARVLAALAEVATPLSVRVVLGPAATAIDQPSLEAHHVEIVRDPAAISDHMRWADLAVTAAGSTMWELSRLAVPMLLLTVADNQLGNARAMHACGAARYLGAADEVPTTELAQAITTLLADHQAPQRMAVRAAALVDGRGALRVVERMRSRSLRLRAARWEDARLAWRWANEREVRAVSFHSEPIPWHEHVAWFERRLIKPQSPFYMAIDGTGRPLGQIRFDREGADAIVSLQLAAEARGRRLAVPLIHAGCRRLFDETDARTVIALIKPENARSQRAFESARFKRRGSVTAFGHAALRYEIGRAALDAVLNPVASGVEQTR